MSVVDRILLLAPGSKFAVREAAPPWTDPSCDRFVRGAYVIDWAKSNAVACPDWDAIQRVDYTPPVPKRVALMEQLEKLKSHSDKDIRDLAVVLKEVL